MYVSRPVSTDRRRPSAEELRQRRRKRRAKKLITWAAAAAVIAAALFFAYRAGLFGGNGGQPLGPNGEPLLKVHVIDVGQGDCILIQAPEKNVLIDSGEEGCGPGIMGYLDALGVNRLDIIVATHPHSDHIGDMDYVIRRIGTVGTVYTTEIPENVSPTTRCYENLLEAIAIRRTELTTAVIGSRISLGEDCTLTFIGPVEPFEDYNDDSLVCRVVFGKNAFLFGGDSGAAAETLLLESGTDISCDCIHLAHHGSSKSSMEAYLDAAGPSIATISCGRDNDYGHPHRATLERLKARGIAYYRTDLQGNIVVTSDGKSITVETER